MVYGVVENLEWWPECPNFKIQKYYGTLCLAEDDDIDSTYLMKGSAEDRKEIALMSK